MNEPDNKTVFRQDCIRTQGTASYVTNYGGYYTRRRDRHLYRQKLQIAHNPGLQRCYRKGRSYAVVMLKHGSPALLHVRVNLRFNPPNDLFTVQTDHIDGDRFNNRADNLRWVTPSENTRKALSSAAKAEEERLRKQNRYKFKSN